MKIASGLRTALVLAILLAMIALLSACSFSFGSNGVSFGSGDSGQPATEVASLSEEAIMQTAVAATLTAAAMPAETPTPSEEQKIQTVVAATLTAVAQPTDTPTPSEEQRVQTAVAATLTQVAASQSSSGSANSTPRPKKTSAATSAPKPTKKPPAAPKVTPIPKPGFVLDFENFGVWKRGAQPYGQLKSTNAKKHEGNKSAELSYDFPKVKDDFVVFLKRPPAPIPGKPDALTIWVYGDGSGHFLNVWVIDSKNEVRQFTFGRIEHKDSWQPMTAQLDTTADWPQDHISGPDNGKLDYPIRLYALVLDSVSDHPTKGVVYLDELVVGDKTAANATPAATGTPQGTGTPSAAATNTPAPAPAALSGHIVYAMAAGGTTNVMALDVASGETKQIFTYGRQPSIRNDGVVLLDAIGNGRNNLFTVHVDGANPRQVSNHTEDSYPDWSPDGAKSVYHSALFGDGKDRIYIQNNATRAEEPAVVSVKGMTAFGRFPTWLPDWRIAYSGCDNWSGGGSCGIWVINADGSGDPIHLTTTPTDLSTDAYGSNVLYASESSGNWELYVIPASGGTAKNLTNNPAQDAAGAYSPDGRSIAFISSRSGNWAIWVMNADGSNPRKLKDVPEGFGPDWQISRISWGP